MNDEQKKLDESLLAWAQWEVDYVNGYKTKELELPEAEQHELLLGCERYTPNTLHTTDGRAIQDKLKDPVVFKIFKILECGSPVKCFVELFEAAKSGKLADHMTFKELCDVFADRFCRTNSTNPNLKYGIRYSETYLDFMVLMRSHGGNSMCQYGILTLQLGGLSPHHLRTLVAKSSDALQNPNLIFENIARVRRLMDAVGYKGPIAVAGDCTKVHPRLAYSTDFGGHILGSTLPLDECQVDEVEDIENVIDRIHKAKAEATQVRAILAKIPLPQYTPQVVALLPTTGKDDACGIHEQLMSLLHMAACLEMHVISLAADGAASELLLQCMMDQEASVMEPFTYSYPLYGIHLQAPVFKTGPLVSITDPPHARKTCRNQPQHGTHTASLGVGFLVNKSLIDLQKTGISGLVTRDVVDVDKQDDGAAQRMFHVAALLAAVEPSISELEGQQYTIRDGFEGIFVYLFMFGLLFDAWISHEMDIKDRVLCALRAHFFLHLWKEYISTLSKAYPDLYSTSCSFISAPSFHIFNRLCDTLVLLALIFTKEYPDQPFCPWLLGTEFVEHFFGLTCMLLPDFAYAELVKIVRHVMVRQWLLLTPTYKENREKDSCAGYILDVDTTPLSNNQSRNTLVGIGSHDDLTDTDLHSSDSDSDPNSEPQGTLEGAGEQKFPDIDLDNTITQSNDYPLLHATPQAHTPYGPEVPSSFDIPSERKITSHVLDSSGKVLVTKMLESWRVMQSGTTMKSERVVQMDPKFALRRVCESAEKVRNNETEIAHEAALKEKLKASEASHRVRLHQSLHAASASQKKTRELQWQVAAKALRKALPEYHV
ncbi:hypothetical protein EDD22DRAFT_954658 [Suillus occidentalis]|nr:hypothetical protein EDD22DRAFT_954658 [Suillus occidentalis]